MSTAAPSHLWPGVPLALGSAVLFAATAPLSKLLLGKVDAQLLAGLLYLGAGVGLMIVHLARRALGVMAPEAPLRRADTPWLAAIILFGGVLGPVLLMLGLNLTDASTGSLLLNLEFLATMGIAWIVFRENVDARLIIGAFAILLGALVLSWEGQGLSLDMGVALIALACLAWGIDNNLTRKLSSADPVQIAMAKGLVAGIVNVGVRVLAGRCASRMVCSRCSGVCWFSGRRRQPGFLRPSASSFGRGAHGSLFFAGSIHRRRRRHCAAARASDFPTRHGWDSHGHWPLVTFGRATSARSCPRLS